MRTAPSCRRERTTELLDRGDPVRAARCAFWLAFHLLIRGESARGGGWLARARRLLDEAAATAWSRGIC